MYLCGGLENTEGLWVLLAMVSVAPLSICETDGNWKVAEKLAGTWQLQENCKRGMK